jgi:hypothetical protein
MRKVVLVILIIGLLAGCGDDPSPLDSYGVPREMIPQAAPLLRFGVEKDGSLSRSKVLAALKREFDAADINHDGVLNFSELNAVNVLRQKRDGIYASLLVDWNHDGVVDFKEFSTMDISLFEQFDTNGDGVVTADEFAGKRRKATYGN